MKKYLTTLIIFIFCGCITIPRLIGQAPAAMTYQAEVRDSKKGILKNTDLDVTLGILEGSIGSIPVLTYNYSVTTDKYGLFSVTIGNPTDLNDPLYSLYWETQPHYLEVQVTDDKNNTYDLGTTQFLSVPYALHAKTAEIAIFDNVDDADADPTNELQNLTLVQDKLKLSVTNDEVSLENYVTPWEVWDDDALRFTGSIDIGDEYFSGAVLRVDGNVLVGKRGENAGMYGISGPITESGLSLRGGKFGSQLYLFGSDHASHANEIHLRTLGTERIFIEPDGNVGIGTAAPDYKLDVSGDINFSGLLYQNGTELNIDDADTDPTNEIQNLTSVLTQSNDGGAIQIKNIANPTDPQDAATKANVDELLTRIENLESLAIPFFTDDDGDGYFLFQVDCNDTDPNIFPGAIEYCDGLDNDCDGFVDEECISLINLNELEVLLNTSFENFNLDEIMNTDPDMYDNFENHLNCTSMEPDEFWPETGWFNKRTNCSIYDCINPVTNYNSGFGVRKRSVLDMEVLTLTSIQENSGTDFSFHFGISPNTMINCLNIPIVIYLDEDFGCHGEVNARVNTNVTINSIDIDIRISINFEERIISLRPSEVSFTNYYVSLDDINPTILDPSLIANSLYSVMNEYFENKVVSEMFLIIQEIIGNNYFP